MPSLTRFRNFIGAFTPVANTKLIDQKPGNNYLYKIQFQKVKPEFHQEYKDLYKDYLAHLENSNQIDDRKEHVGSWMTWYGAQDEAIHLWRYKGNYSSHKFSDSTKEKVVDKNYIKFREERGKMLVSRRNDLIFEFGFCPQIATFADRQLEYAKNMDTSKNSKCVNKNYDPEIIKNPNNLVYEFRQYELKPGNIYQWAYFWDNALKENMRGSDNEFVGAFFSDIGKLNSIYYVWAYPSLESRKHTRDLAFNHEKWSKHITDTQKICRSMNSQILLPLKFSS